MEFSYEMTIGELVGMMNNGCNQSMLYLASRDAGKVIPKDVIPYVFKAAHYDYEKNLYKPTSLTEESKTISELVPIARQLQKQSKADKLNKEIKSSPVIVNGPPRPTKEPEAERIQNIMESNVIDPIFPLNQQEAQTFILQALDITLEDLSTLKSLSQYKANPFESIHESIKQLGGRDRTNKTYYISKEVIDRAAEFCENKSVKVSQFIEVAILEAINKYS